MLQSCGSWARPKSLRAICGYITGNSEEPRTTNLRLPPGGTRATRKPFRFLMGDQPQYIHDNTDDEISHAAFIRAYLASRGASTAERDLLNGPHFRTLPGSTATGSSGKNRLKSADELSGKSFQTIIAARSSSAF